MIYFNSPGRKYWNKIHQSNMKDQINDVSKCIIDIKEDTESMFAYFSIILSFILLKQ